MEFRILGPLEVNDGGRPLSIRRGKDQALLAYLLLHANEVVPTGRLIDALWGERPPPTAPKILQNAVSHLRRELGEGRLVTREPGYVLRVDPGELDSAEFERLAKNGDAGKALLLWRGPPLVELQDETFVDEARRYLDELRLGALEQRIEDDLAAGRHAELIPELEQLVEEHPLREGPRGQLMRALYGAGRQAEALEEYRRARGALSDELGLEPGPELQELERRILQHDPGIAPPRRQRPTPPRGPDGRRRWIALAVVAAVVAGGAIGGIVLATSGSSSPIVAGKNSLAVIDPGKNRVVGVVPIGDTPRGVTVGGGHVWTANAGEGTVSMIDPDDLHVVRTIGVGAAATALVVARGQVWIAAGADNKLIRLDARSGGVLETRDISRDLTASAYAITAGGGDIWLGSGATVYRVDLETQGFTGRRSFLGGGINDIAQHGGSVWLVTSHERVIRLGAVDMRDRDNVDLGVIPVSLAIADGSVWVGAANPTGFGAAIFRLDERTARVINTIPLGGVGYPPNVAVASGAGAIWVAFYDKGEVDRVDTKSASVVARIKVGGHPAGITVGGDRVWVTVT
jgi:DNA-binding SARP family transcriptional activator